MSLQYTHLLIPECVDFVPPPAHVAAFFEGLVTLNSVPLTAAITISKFSGKFRTGSDCLTGDTISIPVRDFTSLENTSGIAERLVGLDDYDVLFSGQGPAKLPPFTLYTVTESEESVFEENYSYDVNCCLRAEVMSTCEEPPFGSPCPSGKRDGIFLHPTTGEAMNVPGAACARFWIEFQFGKWLFPRVGESLNVLEPSILANAIGCFGTEFAQGCIWV
jgi:hypothetical protein